MAIVSPPPRPDAERRETRSISISLPPFSHGLADGRWHLYTILSLILAIPVPLHAHDDKGHDGRPSLSRTIQRRRRWLALAFGMVGGDTRGRISEQCFMWMSQATALEKARKGRRGERHGGQHGGIHRWLAACHDGVRDVDAIMSVVFFSLCVAFEQATFWG